ncbi:hypothetical protein [Tissierella sp.]|uniref:hypothetical protein n=1 Tax=Tissierella sp. TaxID=41274 RepID=UPI00303ECEB1
MDGFLNYNAINQAVHTLVEQAGINISAVLVGSKVLAIAFLLINWLKEFIERKIDPEDGEKKVFPVSLKSLAFGMIYISIIVSWIPITETVDNILGAYVDSFEISEDSNSTTLFAEFNRRYDSERLNESLELPEDNSVIGLLGSLVTLLKDISYGIFFGIILYLVKAIAFVVNLIAYPIFHIERAFLLFLMNIVGPLVIALAAFDKFRELIYKWFKVYCAIFMTGLFFVYVNWFCEGLFSLLYNNFCDKTLNGSITEYNYQDRHLIEVCIFTMIAITKVKLYSSSISLSNRIFS